MRGQKQAQLLEHLFIKAVGFFKLPIVLSDDPLQNRQQRTNRTLGKRPPVLRLSQLIVLAHFVVTPANEPSG